MNALPTAEDIAQIIEEFAPSWHRNLAIAERLLARLRPGWQGLVDECFQRGELLDALRADLAAKDALLEARCTYIAEADHANELLRADLRACAEALAHHSCTERPEWGTTKQRYPDHDCCAALARPGVQEALK